VISLFVKAQKGCLLILFSHFLFLQYSMAEDKPLVTSIVLNTFNDNWSGGFTRIYDDYRSFGLNAGVTFKDRYAVNCQYSGLTAKRTSGYRKDELRLFADVPLYGHKDAAFMVTGKAGLYMYGDYGGKWIQETWHDLFGVRNDTMKYADENSISALFGLEVKSRPLTLSSASDMMLTVQPTMEIVSVPGYFYTVTPDIPVHIKDHGREYISIGVGYRHVEVLSSDEILNRVMDAESGTYISFRMNMGVFFNDYTVFADRGFALGNYGVRWNLGQDTGTFRTCDLAGEFAFLSNGNGYYQKLLWNPSGIFPKNLRFSLFNQHGTYLKKRLKQYPDDYGNYHMTAIGAEWSLFESKKKFQINPYAGLMAGIKQDRVYAGIKDRAPSTLLSPQVSGELGVRIQMPFHLFYKNTLCGIVMNGRYTKLFNDRYDAFISENKVAPSLQFNALGVYVLMDLQ
jgi:hypothetical protein